jgi:large subunit ribosomal protein L27
MAHKKGQGSSRNGRDSQPKMRGVKIYDGQHVIPGNIIVRQLGTVILPGKNVGLGRDHTIFALSEGTVKYERKGKNRKRVSVIPLPAQPAAETESQTQAS